MARGVYIRTKPVWNKGRKGRQRNHNTDGLGLGRGWNKSDEPNKLSYRSKHTWIVANWGKADHCESCGKDKSDRCRFSWSNKDGRYLLTRADWQQLCYSCHKLYDLDRTGFTSWMKGKKGRQPWMNTSGLNGKGGIPWNKGKRLINQQYI